MRNVGTWMMSLIIKRKNRKFTIWITMWIYLDSDDKFTHEIKIYFSSRENTKIIMRFYNEKCNFSNYYMFECNKI